jgi:translation initiation factor 2 subunit 3
LKALELVGIKNVIIVQNKIDLVSEEQAIKNYEQIKDFIKDSFPNAPIIPVSAQQRINIHAVLEAIEKFIPTIKRDLTKEPRMLIARSFDINKPGAKPKNLVGGVLGGAIIQGKLKLNDEIEIRPGVKIKEKYQPLFSKIVGLQKAGINLEEASAGGLLGLMTELDPYLTKSDALVGNVVGLAGKLPEARNFLRVEINLLERLVGSQELKEIEPLKKGEKILINAGTARTLATVSLIKGNIIECELQIPIVVEEKEKVVISRQVTGRWRLIGYGNII